MTENHWHTAYLGLGTNLGEKEQNLNRAMREIESRGGTIVSRSDFYHTSPWGFDSDNKFLNAAIGVKTTLDPQSLLLETQEIERQMGRTLKSSDGAYHDRTIDIDILTYDGLQLSTPSLQIPHPLLAERLFVLAPLAQIAPSLTIPGTECTVATLLSLYMQKHPEEKL